MLEELLARVFKYGEVTILKHLRGLCEVVDGDYVRLAVVEVLKKMTVASGLGEW
jgi:hypothetical protein